MLTFSNKLQFNVPSPSFVTEQLRKQMSRRLLLRELFSIALKKSSVI